MHELKRRQDTVWSPFTWAQLADRDHQIHLKQKLRAVAHCRSVYPYSSESVFPAAIVGDGVRLLCSSSFGSSLPLQACLQGLKGGAIIKEKPMGNVLRRHRGFPPISSSESLAFQRWLPTINNRPWEIFPVWFWMSAIASRLWETIHNVWDNDAVTVPSCQLGTVTRGFWRQEGGWWWVWMSKRCWD